MILAWLISIVTLVFGVFLHLVNISYLAEKIMVKTSKQMVVTPCVVLIAVISQIIIAGLFMCSYLLGISLGLGGFKELSTVTDIFYFSLTTITTLGLGSVEPTGHLRMLAGVESATGFLLISCSAQKVFSTIK
ncbi:ion channel [Alteromonas sp. C1M14]|uniref:ion channel n=1 Tax=Alteromonas sp. C1M14 TaxID=2841567 RepID=UPI001C08C9F8|nr:ion channel [Alteromonas sp. C1M14]MBU2978568.1 hypothetical protein [Alteromonas sp. C1M14]